MMAMVSLVKMMMSDRWMDQWKGREQKGTMEQLSREHCKSAMTINRKVENENKMMMTMMIKTMTTMMMIRI